MFSFLGRMFGSAKAGEQIVNSVSNGLDKLVYTAEEKAEDAAQARREGYQVYMKWLESTTGSRIARRLIAIGVTGIWGLQHLLAQGFALVAIFAESPDRYTEAADLLFKHAQENNALVGVVLLFYFGGPAAIDGVQGLVNKWVNKGQKNDGQ